MTIKIISIASNSIAHETQPQQQSITTFSQHHNKQYFMRYMQYSGTLLHNNLLLHSIAVECQCISNHLILISLTFYAQCCKKKTETL